MRLIIALAESGESGTVTFTENDYPAEDFCRPGEEVIYDEPFTGELPLEFPVNECLSW